MNRNGNENENKKNKNNCHYRDCGAITDNLSRIKNKKSVMPILPAGKIQGIFKLNKIIGRSLEFFRISRKNRDDSFVFGCAKLLTLAGILSFSIITDSRADSACQNSHGGEVTCLEKLTDAEGNNSCGENCSFRVVNENEKQVLHIFKADISKPATISRGAFSPQFYADNQVRDAQNNILPLQNIVFDNDFENIESYAFAGSGAQISNANGKFVLNNAGDYMAFYDNGVRGRATLNGDIILNNSRGYTLEGSNIKGDIIFSDGVAAVGNYAIGNTIIDGNVIIPSSVNSIRYYAINAINITGKIYCASGAETCYNMAKAGCEEYNSETCLNRLNDLFKSKKFSDYLDGCKKLGSGAVCSTCGENFRLNDGECDRIRYTPAEAAAVLHDDNTNSVTITFKK